MLVGSFGTAIRLPGRMASSEVMFRPYRPSGAEGMRSISRRSPRLRSLKVSMKARFWKMLASSAPSITALLGWIALDSSVTVTR